MKIGNNATEAINELVAENTPSAYWPADSPVFVRRSFTHAF